MKKALCCFLALALLLLVFPLNIFAESYNDFEYEALEDGTVAITKYNGNDESVTIPSIIDGHRVVDVLYAFCGNTTINEVVIESGIKHICNSFDNCTNLKKISLPDSVETIEVYAFGNCTSLESIVIPEGVWAISSSFSGCTSLNSIKLPKSITFLRESFKDTAYYKDKNNWEDGVLYIDDCLIKAEGSFRESSIKTGTRVLNANSFSTCESLEKLFIPDSVEYIGNFAFEGCSNINEVTFGNGLKAIYDGAFSSNGKVKRVNITDLEKWCSIDFGNRYSLPLEFDEYLGTLTLNLFVNGNRAKYVELPEGTERINDYAFYGCSSLRELLIPETVKSIGSAETIWGRTNGESGDSVIPPVILGKSGSYAETYAAENNIPFKTYSDYKGFPDVSTNDWYYEAVRYNAMFGYVTGFKNGNFGPANYLQRQDFVVILARVMGDDLSTYNSCKLKDVDMGSYYGKSVAWAVDKGIIKGYDNGNFGVGDKITREQIATILFRLKKPMYWSFYNSSVIERFTDRSKISSFARAPMIWAVYNGIINGKNETTLAPTGFASRAEIATIIMRMDIGIGFHIHNQPLDDRWNNI